MDGDGDVEALERWSQEVTEFLTAKGHPPELIEPFVVRWYNEQVAEWERQRWSTANVDRALGEWGDRVRSELVRPLETRSWRDHWFPPIDETANDAEYTRWLRPDTRAVRMERLAQLGELVRSMRAEGWELACLRFPVSPSIFALEEQAVPREQLQAWCRELGLAYFDYATDSRCRTYDGTHLTHTGGERLSRALARDVQRELGW